MLYGIFVQYDKKLYDALDMTRSSKVSAEVSLSVQTVRSYCIA